tara:strand:+ start:1238 stop:2119 length:882 start_codon:yes stop_codon:yes gene_type:complete
MNAKDLLIALFVPLSWGLGFVAAKSGLDHFPPLLIMSLRFFLSSILLVWFFPIPRGFLIQIFYIAFVSASLQYGLTFSGLNILDTSTASLLIQTEVIFGIITAAIFLNEMPTKKQIVGILVACIGTIILLGTPSVDGKTFGAILVLSGAFCWALGQVMVRSLNGNVNGFTLICWIGVFSSPQMFIMSFFIDGNPIPFILSASLINWFTVFYLGVVMTILGYGAWFYILSKYPMPVAMPFLLLIPVTAIFGAVIFLKEYPSLDVILGGVVIILGISIILINPKIYFTKMKNVND